MRRFFFDTIDNGEILPDDLGVELRDLAEAKAEAARGLAELAQDVLPGSERRVLAVDVRDEEGSRLFTASLVFEVQT